ncbi:hypothetical protein EV426DRAFT_703318 [Tirmania nivea]|nr:hypothetical protein EV426DRAFT_703318 [Tirmania nivea]
MSHAGGQYPASHQYDDDEFEGIMYQEGGPRYISQQQGHASMEDPYQMQWEYTMELQPPSAEPQALAEAPPRPTEAPQQLPVAAPQLQQQLPLAQPSHEHAPTRPSPLSIVPPITPRAPDDGSLEQDSAAEGDAPATPNMAAFRSPMSVRGGRGRGRGGSRGGRGRRKSSGTPLKEGSIDDTDEEEFTMEGIKTKSGRKVHKPTQFDPAAKTPTRRRGPYRRFHDSRICKICQRGHSPQSNMIVFCDGCNVPYHQLCHDPPIDDFVIAVADAEWFCKDCSSRRMDRPLVTGMSGANLTEDEKRTYLASLPMGSLVELLFLAERQHPDLQLYDPNTKAIVAEIKAAATSHEVPIKAMPVRGGGVHTNGDIIAPGARGRASIDYEELIIRALAAINDPVGVQPKIIWEWLKTNYTHLANREVRAEAQNPLQKLLRLNRIIREGHQYRVNYEHSANMFVSPSAGATALSRIAISNHVNARVVDATSASSHESPTGLLLPGAGIKLPPENEDDTMLVEDEAHRAFSHKWGMGVVGVVGVVEVVTVADAEGGKDVVMADGGDDVDAEGVDDVMA